MLRMTISLILSGMLSLVSVCSASTIGEHLDDFKDYEFGDYDYYVKYGVSNLYEENNGFRVHDTEDAPVKATETLLTTVNSKSGVATGIAKSKRKKLDKFSNQIVVTAPAAEIKFGDDIDDEGNCQKEIEDYCDGIDEGESQLADCICDMITESESDLDDKPDISDTCREEVYQFKISRNANINRNIRLAKQCKNDADKYCNNTWFFGYKQGQIIGCLREVKEKLEKKCKYQVFKTMQDAAADFRADPVLYTACKDDAANLCRDVKNGGGRVQACLRDKRMSLSWACEEQLYRQEVEDADDIRLSVRMFAACMTDKRKFCKDIEPGHARVKDCLEDHRQDLTSRCKAEIDSAIERRLRDFRLDTQLREDCGNDILNLCAYVGDVGELDSFDQSVKNCLQDYRDDIKSKDCKKHIKRYIELASEDIRFNIPLADACFDDRQKYCGSIPSGSARVIRCLMGKRKALTPHCRSTLFDEEVRFSENIDFQMPMKDACITELATFCKDVPHGDAKVIRCLQDNKNEKGFGKACKAEVESFENQMSTDYRLNYRLVRACEKDMAKLCPTACSTMNGSEDQVCGGKMLRCMADNMDDIKDQDCRKEVVYFEKMEVEDFRNDVILAEACRDDVDKICAKIKPGEGRVHQCLRDNRKKLSDACRKEELLLEEKEAESIELSGNLLRACKAERKLFCKAVRAGSARVFRCMAQHMNDPDFGGQCKTMIRSKLERRQANWKLDPPLRKACRADVTSMCAAEASTNSEEGAVYKCLINSIDDLSSGCQHELGRAVHMALYIWRPDSEAILGRDCDDDIKSLCLSKRPNMASKLGAVSECLGRIAAREAGSSERRLQEDGNFDEEEFEEEFEVTGSAGSKRAFDRGPGRPRLSEKCYELVDIAEPPDARRSFDDSLSFAFLKDSLNMIEVNTGLPTVKRDRSGVARGISLTGWMATFGMASLVLLASYALYMLYQSLQRGPGDRDYTMVVKQRFKS